MVMTSSSLYGDPQPQAQQPQAQPKQPDVNNVVPEKIKSDGGSTKYYELPPNPKELNDLIEFKNMNFALANIFKACYRFDEKDGVEKMYDINKIIYFAERLKLMVERGQI